MQTRHGTMATERPQRYAKQLAGHWARKGSAGDEDGATVIRFDTGQVVRMWPAEGLLHVEASVPDEGDPDRFAQVVKDHLERFGKRDELDVVWDPAAGDGPHSGTGPDGIRPLPQGFVLGVATAGHQNEGQNTASDTWFLEHTTPSVFREPSGRACNGYELWRDDLDLVKGMGLDAYRFSVEWARVEPSEGTVDEAALDHYEAIVDRCAELGLAPVVTFNHFTAPHWFAAEGGWLSSRSAELFARYCGWVMDRFGDRIAYAVTLNEPNLTRLLSWLDLPAVIRDLERATLDAASAAAGVERYRVGNVMLPEDMDAIGDGMTAGHRAARAAIKARRPELPVGFSLAVVDDRVVGDDAAFRDRKRHEVYARWLELAHEDDFLGIQNYESRTYDGAGEVAPAPGTPVNGMGSAIDPTSLAGAVRYAHAESGVPILVTEHGMQTPDDSQRAGFIEPSLVALLEAMDDGVPVLGYLHWTLMDNFEWIFGYGAQLGLHEVDRETFVRTPKPSAAVYASVAGARRVRA
ncbi:aryl-beta-glucosidase [Humibacillus xanthopallidus]|uniref:Aryl-beta-glucosidase n=1 Tax=Humibacillus xanthopallidus TaxID=412689 RepID=A0A543PUL6_9MICO|nr:family 1 glycosylhydrolase [Humibacillus xanthopallidus]TQN47768.1 aryl-beta-glucosidase [Humibacillus xanthopallidus]